MKYEKIIWISLDTLRADCINFNKKKLFSKEYKTRTKLRNTTFDELCSKGCFFSNVISTAPYTSNSHASYFTGKYPKKHGLFDQFNSKLSCETIFADAQKKGFHTVFKTDFPFVLGKYLNITTKGIDKYIVEDNEDFLKEISKEGKSFAFAHFGQIHYPYGFHNVNFGADAYREKVRTLIEKHKVKIDEQDLSDMAIETFRTEEDLDLLYKYKKIIAKLYKEKKDDELFDLYLEGINYFHENMFDDFLDNLLEIVKEKNFLIIISADHGEAWSDETYGHHNSLEEGVIRVPVLFYAKDIAPRVYDNRIRTIDIAPTVAKLLNLKEHSWDGKPVTSIIYDGDTEEHRNAFSAVWVNESSDVLKKIQTIVKDDELEAARDISVKYSFAYYSGNQKFIKNYKFFADRGNKIVDFDREELFKIGESGTTFTLIDDKAQKSKMRVIGEELNNIKPIKTLKKSKTMKEYFNFQGYKI